MLKLTMDAPLLTFTRKEFEAFKLGMSQRRPVHILSCYDGDNTVQVERRYPVDPLPYCWSLVKPGETIPICKHCKHPEPKYYKMDEQVYGPKALLCGNCEQLSYLKG